MLTFGVAFARTAAVIQLRNHASHIACEDILRHAHVLESAEHAALNLDSLGALNYPQPPSTIPEKDALDRLCVPAQHAQVD